MPYNNIRMNGGGWSPDDTIENQSWLRQSWQLPITVEGFLKSVHPDVEGPITFQQLQAKCEQFMTYPVSRYMPQALHDKLVEQGYLKE